jgi:hypothetical protein
MTMATFWMRQRAGLYVRLINGHRFEVEHQDRRDQDDSKTRWICRRDGIAFDTGNTLAEAKTYCVEPEPEGKPLIEILS